MLFIFCNSVIANIIVVKQVVMTFITISAGQVGEVHDWQ